MGEIDGVGATSMTRSRGGKKGVAKGETFRRSEVEIGLAETKVQGKGVTLVTLGGCKDIY